MVDVRSMMAPLPLRLARATRFLPRFRGLNALLRLYRRVLPHDRLFRVNDFDDDLKLDVNVCDVIGINVWHAPGLWEKKERELFCSAVRPGTVVLDVGANVGIYTLLAAKRGASVFACEPDPANLLALHTHININGLSDRVTVLEMAATDYSRPMSLYRNPANSGGSTLVGSGNGIAVEGRTIDSLNLPPIDICKMDVEGSEIVALRGMKETLAHSPEMKLLVECSPELLDTAELLSILHREFRSVSIVGGARLSPSDPPPGKCNLWACH